MGVGRRGFGLILVLAVMLPRLAWFAWLGGELPQPPRDQPVYIRMAASLLEGRGLSFDESLALLKNTRQSDDTEALSGAWNIPGYVFGITPVETPTATIEPGYPLLLAGLFLVTGPVTGAVYLLNCIAFLLGAWAVWRLASGSWGEGVGRAAALVWSVYPWYVYYSAYALTESLHIALVPVIVLAVLRVQEGRGSGFAAGAATGVLFLVRSTALFLLPLEAVHLFLTRRRRALLPLLAGFAVCAVPWVVRNQIEMGSPVLLPTKGALNLWMRNNPAVLELEGIRVPEWIGTRRDDLLSYPHFDDSQGEIDRTRILGARALSYISANPLLYAWLSGGRLVRFLLPVSTGADSGAATTLGFVLGFVLYLPMLVLTVIEFARRRREQPVRLLAGIFLLYTVMHTLAHGGVRYRLPVDLVPIVGTCLFFAGRAGRRAAETSKAPSPTGEAGE